MENNFDEIFGWMVEEQKRFEEKHKEMSAPKYEKGDVVKFQFSEAMDTLEGMVEIVDRYGTFEQNEEPSYDIYRFENNTLYKHVRESMVKEFVRNGTLHEIEDSIKRFGF